MVNYVMVASRSVLLTSRISYRVAGPYHDFSAPYPNVIP